MSGQPFAVVALDTVRHDRNRFNSGVPALDRYLREQVSQDIRRRVTACFVAVGEGSCIAAYYTLSTASVPLIDLPEPYRRKLPRYDSIPAIRMSRMALNCLRNAEQSKSSICRRKMRACFNDEYRHQVLFGSKGI